MDNIVKHWAVLPRRFPSLANVKTIGHMPCKLDWVRTTFGTFNFSLILKGGGSFHALGKSWSVEAPCILVEPPGIWLEYGPESPHEFWHEFYIIYDAESSDYFKKIGFYKNEAFVFDMVSDVFLKTRLQKLDQLAGDPKDPGLADRIDRECEMLLLDCFCGGPILERTESERKIEEIQLYVRSNLRECIDWDQVAENHGMSPATFRRYWRRRFSHPPGKYLLRLRIQEAKRLLIESSLPINQIADRVGFQDPLYFSRVFRAEAQLPAREYRKSFQIR
ncbi:MAG: AraC family transcriptional regulator [Verrucomicrobiota bacterium]